MLSGTKTGKPNSPKNVDKTQIWIFSLDEAGNEKNLQASEFVFKKGFLKTETKSFFSGLRPVCADDVAIIGEFRLKFSLLLNRFIL